MQRIRPAADYHANFSQSLRRYFYSGWAFLVPYLAAYLLYYWREWPVNPLKEGSTVQGAGSVWAPPLLYVYWAFHAIHIGLAANALRSWWRKERQVEQRSEDKVQAPIPTAPPASTKTLHETVLQKIAPWLFLALIFYIPGVYLEWPSDPWEHLRRINEWHISSTVGAHSYWHRSTYFIPYSMLQWCSGLRQLIWLDFYYTGMSLLLCWQYYRLARACNLNARIAMFFVVIQALFFGNNIFSFYRYYGISSSIYAQLGSVALTRIAIEFASRGTKQALHAKQKARSKQIGNFQFPSGRSLPSSAIEQSGNPPSIVQLLASGLCLLALTAFNHIQGLVIAGLGITAITAWRLVERRQAALWWLIGCTIVINTLIVWLYPLPPIIEDYRTQGWLNAWYGFNIFAPSSSAADRMSQILSVFGLGNVVAAILLFRKNHIAAWITILPLIATQVPAFSITFAIRVADSGLPGNILTFQRFLFAIPQALATVTFFESLFRIPFTDQRLIRSNSIHRSQLALPILAPLCLVALVTIPPSGSSFNRFWHSLTVPAVDLSLGSWLALCQPAPTDLGHFSNARVMTTMVGRAVLNAWANERADVRTINQPASNSVDRLFSEIPVGSNKFRSILSDSHTFGTHANTAYSIQHIPSAGTERSLTNRLHEPDAWISLDGTSAPSLVANSPVGGAVTIQNPPNAASFAFTKDLIPIRPERSYSVNLHVRQASGPPAKIYLAIAWYNSAGIPLPSNEHGPAGAGFPAGWDNGTYSYFGLVGETPQNSWVAYHKEFGGGHSTQVPLGAHFMRVGALLNYDQVPMASVQITIPIITEIPNLRLELVAPNAFAVHSFASQAALLSGHWGPQEVSLTTTAGREIVAAGSAWSDALTHQQK